MTSRKKSSKVRRLKKVLAVLPKEKGQSVRTDEAFELLEQLVKMQSKQYVISVYPSINTTPL
jgi:hypothetical protein